MLTLLKKRQARNAAKIAHETRCEDESLVSDEPLLEALIPSSDDPLAGKPWDEVQRILAVDLEFVRTLAGFEEKNAFRKELVKKYKGQVAHLLATHKSLEGIDLVWWYYLWQIDCGLLPLVHDAFKAAVMRGLSTPKQWNTNGQTAYCDLIFKYSHKAHTEKTPFNALYLTKAIADIAEGKIAINAPLKVKMFRLAGDLFDEAGNKKEALALFETVMQIDPNKGGRKKRAKELKEEFAHGQDQ